MELTEKERQRASEVYFYQIYTHLKDNIPSDKFFIYLESFCRVFEIDYTSIMIVCTRFIRRIKPSMQDEIVLAIKLGGKLKDLGYDYRTIRKYRTELEQGKIGLYPVISNQFVSKDLEKFIKAHNSIQISSTLLSAFSRGGE